MEDNDVQLQLKKRAHRRLVGAVAFVSLAAVVLPLIMDQEPRQPVQDVEIRIPGQDEKPLVPKPVVVPVEKAPVARTEPRPPVVDAKPVAEIPPVVAAADTRREPVAQDIPPEKNVKPAEKPVEKPLEKAKPDDAKRAAAILSGQPGTDAPVAKGGDFLILIGAFANEANVRNLKEKLGQQGIRTFTEPLDTPQGKKTRVRAGPFPTRDAAEKALEKMQKIGVSGVVSAK